MCGGVSDRGGSVIRNRDLSRCINRKDDESNFH